MVRIGLTGGPGSGKSTVAKIFKRRKIAFSDLDYLSRVAVKPGQPAYLKIVDYFGDSVVGTSGDLDRAVLRSRLIDNPEDKKVLETFIHPEVFRLLELEGEKYSGQGEKVFCVEAPLLFEAGMSGSFDYVITVFAPYDLQVKRVMERDFVTRESAKGLIDSQIPLEKKASMSDFVIHNDKGLKELESQVDEILFKIGITA